MQTQFPSPLVSLPNFVKNPNITGTKNENSLRFLEDDIEKPDDEFDLNISHWGTQQVIYVMATKSDHSWEFFWLTMRVNHFNFIGSRNITRTS